jgi:hypothetical protein
MPLPADLADECGILFQMKTAKKKTQSRAPATRHGDGKRIPRKRPPADLREFYGILSKEAASQMIRDIEEAFEHVDAE